MNEYYEEIEQYIKRNEVNKVARRLEENQDTLVNYWNIGRLLVEAQGGKEKAKYGNELIQTWAEEFTKLYGKGYNRANLFRFRQFYLSFPNVAPLGRLSWTHIRTLLPIKEVNKRNYYINLCITKKLSKRELEREIKNNTYERLINKPEKIEIILPTPKYRIMDNLHNPILLELNEGESIESEHDLEIALLARLKSFFSQLGEGFLLAGNQYKVTHENKNYYIDILLYNIKMDCYVVVELKVRNLRKEDKGQIEFYMKLVDEQIKEPRNNKTIGILITKEQDKFVANFVSSETIIPLTYEVC